MENLEEKNASDNTKRYFGNYNNNPFLSIFGFDLYSDDILILCILFSMYMEGIKDQMLFMILLLLLFS